MRCSIPLLLMATSGLHGWQQKKLPSRRHAAARCLDISDGILHIHAKLCFCIQAKEARQRALSAFRICLGTQHEKYTDLASRKGFR